MDTLNRKTTTYTSSDGTSITLIDYPPFNDPNYRTIQWGLTRPSYTNHMYTLKKSYKVTIGTIK